MKLKNILCSAMAFAMVATSCVCANAATFTAGSESASAGKTVSIPISVAPSDGETSADVNAYAIAISYDSSVLTPVAKGTDAVGDTTYAAVGDAFNSGVLTADLKDNATGNDEVLVGWANATAVNVTSATTIATVEFTVNDTTTVSSTDVDIAVAQVANSATTIADASTITAAKGTVTLTSDVLYGDVNDSKTVTMADASLVARYANGDSTVVFTPVQIKAGNVNGSVDSEGNATITMADAALIAMKANDSTVVFPVEK